MVMATSTFYPLALGLSHQGRTRHQNDWGEWRNPAPPLSGTFAWFSAILCWNDDGEREFLTSSNEPRAGFQIKLVVMDPINTWLSLSTVTGLGGESDKGGGREAEGCVGGKGGEGGRGKRKEKKGREGER